LSHLDVHRFVAPGIGDEQRQPDAENEQSFLGQAPHVDVPYAPALRARAG
jgi:hypothetical protein